MRPGMRIAWLLLAGLLAPAGAAANDVVARGFVLPFETKDRSAFKSVRVVSRFGAYRRSFKPGHLHSGTDLLPRGRLKDPVEVFPMAPGEVCSIHLDAPHTTVVVRHRLPDKSTIYTSYKHMTELSVTEGARVTPDTRLGRLFTRKEARELGGPYRHLHLEVRTRFDDGGSASWTSMSREELESRFVDPVPFLKQRLRPPRPMPQARTRRFLAAARELLGLTYRFGGRLRQPGDGIDCQGVLFYAAERICPCGWKSYSTMPTESVARGELGRAVPGLDPVATSLLDTGKLEPGDIILLLADAENSAEPSIAAIGDKPVWVWHTGIHTGEGRLLHADIFTGKVVEQDMRAYLEEHDYAGIFVTRMRARPRPKRCRRHRRMKIPELDPRQKHSGMTEQSHSRTK